MGTLVTGLVLLAVLALAVRSIIHDKKNGACSCGGSCGGACSCGGSCGAHCGGQQQ